MEERRETLDKHGQGRKLRLEKGAALHGEGGAVQQHDEKLEKD